MNFQTNESTGVAQTFLSAVSPTFLSAAPAHARACSGFSEASQAGMPARRHTGASALPWFWITFVFLALFAATSAHAQTNANSINLNIGLNGLSEPTDVDGAIKILAVMTLLTLAPSIILLTTCFTRIVIVLSFVRSALSLQGTPSNQIMIGLSLFLTFFIMSPVWEKIDQEALTPYRAKQITSAEALQRATVPIRAFMLKQTRPKDVELFVALAKIGPTPADQLPLKIVIPSFIISELRTAFQMGFLLFVPFILIDLIVATVLMSMGMMMMPPMTISLPLKILLFVLVDGWHLVVSSIVQSFGT
jgi:flagellar biosynthetic protein FliP